MRVLVIEDNSNLVMNIYEYFEPKGYTLDSAADGLTGLHLATTNHYDAVILDLSLPGIDGIELCRRLRHDMGSDVPILMLTAREQLDDKLQGFNVGADDYLVKPVALAELEARIGAAVRRNQGSFSQQKGLRFEDLTYEPSTMSFTRAGQTIRLNPICRKILILLMRNAPAVVTREQIGYEIWGDQPPDSDALRAHIYTIRNEIDKPFNKKLLKTIHREGYRLAHEESNCDA